MRIECGSHRGGRHAAVDAERRIDRRRQVMGGQLPQLKGVIDGLVAVARHDDLTAEGCQRADARQQADRAAPHQIPAAAAAVQDGGALHGGGQNAVRIVQVVRTVNFGHIPRSAAKPRCGQGAALVAGHVQRVAGSGESF